MCTSNGLDNGRDIMAKRVLIGEHQTYGYGVYVSKPGEDVDAANNYDDLIFRTDLTDNTSGVVSLNGQTAQIAQKGFSDVTISSGNWNASTGNITYTRSYFNDGTVDRAPYILSSVGQVTGSSPATQWATSYYKTRSNNSSDKRFSYHGYRLIVKPYLNTTTGSFYFNVGRNALYDSDTDNSSAEVTFRCFYALTFLTLR